MVQRIFEKFSEMPSVEAIALGGSRAGEIFDEKSDYDVYIYCTENISETERKNILSEFCSYMEIGNHFWEYEDNCTLKNGIDIDILYRDLNDICEDVADVVERYHAHNGYTTCIWHNLINSKIIFDRNGRLAQAQKRFSVEYPEKLKENIIKRNMALLSEKMPAYKFQIKKAVERNDVVSINHRTSAFMESYFDIIFALNKLTHTGEKRLVRICREKCKILPDDFEENINQLFKDLFNDKDKICEDLEKMISELKKIIGVEI